jgi:hypothetical protein
MDSRKSAVAYSHKERLHAQAELGAERGAVFVLTKVDRRASRRIDEQAGGVKLKCNLRPFEPHFLPRLF